jgi:hypothetical protein
MRQTVSRNLRARAAWRMNKTTIFILAIISGELIRFSLFGFIHHEANSTKFSNLFKSLIHTRRDSSPCNGTDSSNFDCTSSPPTRNDTKRVFNIHVFLYRRLDSAALLLHDLTNAEYKVDHLPAFLLPLYKHVYAHILPHRTYISSVESSMSSTFRCQPH